MENRRQASARAQTLRQRLYEMKNGIVADTLRAGGCPYRMIWGLNLPQLSQIATTVEPSMELAREMWADTTLREAHLLGPMLCDPCAMTLEEAQKWVGGVKWPEDADILCFKLLRRLPFVKDLARRLVDTAGDDALKRYTALRLLFNIVAQEPKLAKEAAEDELRRKEPISTLARMLREEAMFVLGEEDSLISEDKDI